MNTLLCDGLGERCGDNDDDKETLEKGGDEILDKVFCELSGEEYAVPLVALDTDAHDLCDVSTESIDIPV